MREALEILNRRLFLLRSKLLSIMVKIALIHKKVDNFSACADCYFILEISILKIVSNSMNIRQV